LTEVTDNRSAAPMRPLLRQHSVACNIHRHLQAFISLGLIFFVGTNSLNIACYERDTCNRSF